MDREIKISIHALKQGRFQVSYYHPITKNRIRRKFKREVEAKNHQMSLLKQFLTNGLNSSSALPVANWMQTYLESVPDAFIKRLGRPMFEHFVENFGHRPAMEITQEELGQWIKDVQEARNYSSRTIPNIKSGINQFFEFLIEAKTLQKNPMAKVKNEKGLPKRERVILDEAEIEDLLEKVKAISPDIVYPVVFLLCHTGARLGEILNLKWNQVHFELGAIHLLKTKNGDDRFVHVNSHVLDFLESRPRASEYVMLNIRGERWTMAQYTKQFSKIRRKVAFRKYWCNHSLRHSFAANYQRQGGDMTQLQAILGHHDLSMTLDLYGQINAEDVLDPSPYNF